MSTPSQPFPPMAPNQYVLLPWWTFARLSEGLCQRQEHCALGFDRAPDGTLVPWTGR